MAKSAAKKKARPRNNRKPQTEKPLPPPVEPGALPEPGKQSGGLFDLGTIFQSSQQPSQKGSSIPSVNSSNANGEPMAADAARLLDSVPEAIGDDGQDAPPSGEQLEPPSVSAGAVVIGAETMQQLLLWLTDKLAVWRRIDAYRLNDSGAAMLAGPYSQVLNGLWDRLAPAFLSQICVSVPGLAEAAALSAVAFWPAIQEEMKRGRKAVRIPHQRSDSAPTEMPKRGGMIYEGGKAE